MWYQNFYHSILLFINQKCFYFFLFFFVIWHATIHHLVECHATGINFLLIYFLHALHFLHLLRQAISLTLIIVLKSCSPKYHHQVQYYWRFNWLYSIKIQVIAKKGNIMRVFINNDYIISRESHIIKFYS